MGADAAAEVVHLRQRVEIRRRGQDAPGLSDLILSGHGQRRDDDRRNGEHVRPARAVGVQNPPDGVLHSVDLRAAAQERLAHVHRAFQQPLRIHFRFPLSPGQLFVNLVVDQAVLHRRVGGDVVATAMTKPGQRLPTSMQRRTSASMASRPPESRMDVSALPTNTWVLPYFSAI